MPLPMIAFLGVWVGLATLLLAVGMLVHRPWFTDVTVPLVVMFGSPGSLCLCGIVLWALRKEDSSDPAIVAQRRQAKVGIALALTAAAIVYLLVIFAEQRSPV